jgi:hypothetical protein
VSPAPLGHKGSRARGVTLVQLGQPAPPASWETKAMPARPDRRARAASRDRLALLDRLVSLACVGST